MTDWRRILQGLYKRTAQMMGTSHPDRSALTDYMDKLSELQRTDFDEDALHKAGLKHREGPVFTTSEEVAMRNALDNYTGSGSKMLNSLYRDPEHVGSIYYDDRSRAEWEEINENLLKAYMPAPHDLVVYRGLSPTSSTAKRIADVPIENDIEYVPRFDRYATKGHVSTSLKPSIATDWANGTNGLAYRILVPQGAPIIPALRSSGSPNEREIILRPNSEGANFYKRIDRMGDGVRFIEPDYRDYKIASGVNFPDAPYADGVMYDDKQYIQDLQRFQAKQDDKVKQHQILVDSVSKAPSNRELDQYYDESSKLNKSLNDAKPKKADYAIGSKVNMGNPTALQYSPHNVYDESAYEKARSEYEANKFVNLVMSGRRGVGKNAPQIAGVAGPAIGLSALLEKYGASPSGDEDEFK